MTIKRKPVAFGDLRGWIAALEAAGEVREIDAEDAGAFHIAGRRQGVLVTIRRRLELPASASDSGPYLYLSPGNAENHAFLLKKTSKPCK